MDTKALRQKILDLAIHGRLVPQDPNDEPASVLLERIRDEKERLIKEGKIKRSKKSATASDTPHYENVPFEVPDSWVWCRLNEIADSSLGKTLDQNKNTGKEYPYLCAINVKWDDFDFSVVKTIKLDDNEKERYLVKRGDLLICEGGDVGRSAIWTNDEPIYYQNALHRVRFFDKIITKFYLYLIWCYKNYNWIDDICNGVTIKHFTQDKINSLLFPLPPLPEQHRIAAEIEKWFALIDQIEQGKASLQTTIKQTKSKILDLAIHGRLVPQDPNDEPAIELLKRINPDFTPCDNGHDKQLPQGWSIAPMQMLCTLVDGEKQSCIERINLDVKYLRGEHDAKTLSSGKYVAANSLLILVDGENSGEVFRTPIDGYQGSTFKQLSIKHDMNTEYVLQVINLHKKILRENKVGSAIPHLNKKLFKAIEVPIPPYKEQQRIIDAINKAFISLDKIMESL